MLKEYKIGCSFNISALLTQNFNTETESVNLVISYPYFWLVKSYFDII